MSKNKTHPHVECDDEFFAQLDFLRDDYDKSLEEMEKQKKDIQKLMALLVENNIPIPNELVDRYIRRAAEKEEELPFN